MKKQFEDLYYRAQETLECIEEPTERMTIKEIQEAMSDMKQILQKFVEVCDDLRLEELCNYKQLAV